MEDTLRYFFSAVFQGFAAIITLGIMFYIYYIDKQSRKIDEIEKKLMIFEPNLQTANYEEKINYYVEHGIFKYASHYLLPPLIEAKPMHQIVVAMKKYDLIIKQKEFLSKKIKELFKIATLILIVSLVSLFMIGYYQWLSIALFIIGIITILLCIIFFTRLFTFSKSIIDGPF